MTPDDRVFGTPVWSALDDDRPEAWLLSDLHVGVDGGAVLENLGAVLTAAAAAGPAARVLLLGDLFDSYVGARQLQVGVWRSVVERLRAAADAGVSVTVLHGNRDFLLGAAFARLTGCRVVAGGLRCRLGGRQALLLHGDELCLEDLPYQRAKRWLRSWPVAALARVLPLGLALRLAARARARSQAVIRSGDQTRFLPPPRAIDGALAGTEVLVFGHIHRLAHGRRGGGEYWVLPAFDREPRVLRDGQGGLRLASVAGQPVPAPPPLPGL